MTYQGDTQTPQPYYQPTPPAKKPRRWLLPTLTGIGGFIMGIIACVVTLAVIGLSTGSGTTGSPTKAPEAAAEPSESNEPEPTPTQSSGNNRGHDVAAVGTPITFGNANTGEQLATVTVNSITPDFKCTRGSTLTPENGHMIALDVTFAAGSDTKSKTNGVGISNLYYTWDYYTADGVKTNEAVTDMSINCVPRSQMLAGEVGDNQTVKGLVVLDVPTTDGSIAFSPYWLDKAVEWPAR